MDGHAIVPGLRDLEKLGVVITLLFPGIRPGIRYPKSRMIIYQGEAILCRRELKGIRRESSSPVVRFY